MSSTRPALRGPSARNLRGPGGRSALVLSLLALAGPAACGRSPSGAGGGNPSAARELPAPTRPAGMLGHVHLGQPRATGRSVGRFAGLPLPLDLLLMAQFGVDSTLLTTVDLTKPVDALVLGPTERPHFVASFVPTAMNTLRSTLTGRFRMTPTEGLGERLDPRSPEETSAAPAEEEPGRRRRAPHAVCALVPLPTDVAMPARVVCSDDAETLVRAGRFAAYSSRDYAADHDDFVLRLEGDDARAVLAARLGSIARGLTDDLGSSASAARRDRPRAPDLGDPEAVVAALRELTDDVPGSLRDVRALTLRGAVRPEGLVLTAEVPLDAAGTTALAHDAQARAGAPMEHALANRLATDAVAVLAARGTEARTRLQVRSVAQMALRVLGERVSDQAAARADVEALLAQTSDAVAMSVAASAPTSPSAAGGAAAVRAAPSAAASASAEGSAGAPGVEPPPAALEVIAVLSQADRGVAARAALARIAQAPWLRTARLGAGPLVVRTTRDGALVVRLPPPTPTVAETVGERAVPPPSLVPSELGIAVANDALVMVAGPNAERILAGVAARAGAGAGGVQPRALTAVRPPAAVSFAFDPAPLMDPSQRGADEDRVRNVLTVTYGAEGGAGQLTSRMQLRVPGSAISMLRRTLMGGRRRGGGGPGGPGGGMGGRRRFGGPGGGMGGGMGGRPPMLAPMGGEPESGSEP